MARRVTDSFAVLSLGVPVIRSAAILNVQGGLRPIFGAVHWFERLLFFHFLPIFG